MEGEGVALFEAANRLIVAAPRHAKLDAIVLIFDAQAITNRLEPVGDGKRVLVLAGEIDDAGAEDRPIFAEQDSPCDPQFLDVTKVLDGRVDITVQPEIADLGIGLLRPDGEIDFITPDRERVLVDSESVREIDEPAVADIGSANDIGNPSGEAGSLREDIRQAAEPVALADVAFDREVLAVERPVDAIGDPRRVLPAVVPGEAVQREQVAVFEVDRA